MAQDQDGVGLQEPAVSASDCCVSLKLKIPKPERMEGDDHDHDLVRLPRDLLVRRCSECGKGFISGKALGGHKRACLQRKSQKLTVKKVVELDREGTDELQKNSSLNCYVCQQSFRSLKSLYGHMRKHPEREWRGIQPPQATGNNNGDNDQRDDGASDGAGSTVDLVDSLKSWSVKARRGHRLSETRVSTSASDQDEREDMQQAVNDLLLLAEYRANKRGFDQVSSAGSGYGVLKIKGLRSDTDKDGIKRSEIVRNFNLERGKERTGLEAEFGTKNGRCNSEDTWLVNDCEYDSEVEISRKTKQQKKKKRRLVELDDVEGVNEEPVATQTYSCPICDKIFTKHQALGGHVASHNKNNKNNNNLSLVKESSASAAVSASEDGNCNKTNTTTSKVVENDQRQVGSEETAELSRIAAAGDEHQCNICSKTFPTGQALGGHKRCHWTGPAEAFSSSSQVTTSAGEVTQTARRVVFEFDLNDTPPEYYQVYGGETAAAAQLSMLGG